MFHHDLQHTGRSTYLGPHLLTRSGTSRSATRDHPLPLSTQTARFMSAATTAGSTPSSPTARRSGSSWQAARCNPLPSSPQTEKSTSAASTTSSTQSSLTALKSGSSKPVASLHPLRPRRRRDDLLWKLGPQALRRQTRRHEEVGVLTGDAVSASPAIAADGTIYFGSGNTLYALGPDGTKKWEFVTADGMSSDPSIASDGTIYFGSRDKNVYAINPDGTKKWEFATGDDVKSSPAIGADGTIYVGSATRSSMRSMPTAPRSGSSPPAIMCSPRPPSAQTGLSTSAQTSSTQSMPTARRNGNSSPAAQCNLPRSPPMARSTSAASTTRSTLSDPGADERVPSVPGLAQ